MSIMLINQKIDTVLLHRTAMASQEVVETFLRKQQWLLSRATGKEDISISGVSFDLSDFKKKRKKKKKKKKKGE